MSKRTLKDLAFSKQVLFKKVAVYLRCKRFFKILISVSISPRRYHSSTKKILVILSKVQVAGYS